jgi:hypothetical protein
VGRQAGTGEYRIPGRDAAFFTLLRRTGTPVAVETPALQRTGSQELRAALRPGNEATPQKKNPASRRDFPSLTHSPSITSELPVPLALLILAALAVRILLLLAGLLAAALLLAGLLTRVLILLARILVLVGHSGSPYLRCWGMQRKDNREGRGLVSEKTSVPARSLRGADLS